MQSKRTLNEINTRFSISPDSSAFEKVPAE